VGKLWGKGPVTEATSHLKHAHCRISRKSMHNSAHRGSCQRHPICRLSPTSQSPETGSPTIHELSTLRALAPKITARLIERPACSMMKHGFISALSQHSFKRGRLLQGYSLLGRLRPLTFLFSLPGSPPQCLTFSTPRSRGNYAASVQKWNKRRGLKKYDLSRA
jgi:hypothetical protein